MLAAKPAPWIPDSITLLGILTMITPLCGVLFGCGCTWPWSGLVEYCNYFDPYEEHRCPFCEHLTWSIPLISACALIGLAIARAGIFRIFDSGLIVLDSLGGLIVFILLILIVGSLF